MAGERKTVVVIILLAVIIVAGALIAKNFRTGASKPPSFVTERPVEKIDKETLEPITLPLSEWEKLGIQDGMWKNPETGEFTVLSITVCSSCGKKIPAPPLPIDPDAAAYDEIRREYVCPRCGKKAYLILESTNRPMRKTGPLGPRKNRD